MDERTFDTIIVGAGPAGCVLAARLSEDVDRQVLLIDAGPDYGSDPAGWPPELLDPYATEWVSHAWGYTNAAAEDGAIRHGLPRARVFGGCSTVNACQWFRGSRIDYDAWETAGNTGWGWDDLFPYFLKSESDDHGDPSVHGDAGPVRISREPDERLGLSDRLLAETAAELGFEWLDDLNGSDRQFPSLGRTPKNIDNGHRLNGSLTYLKAARDRANLTLLPDTLIDRVLMEGTRAVGVRAADGRELRAREVIVSGGAYASPAILLRSGIGAAGQLHDLGIPLVRDLSGVGQHLLDHPFISPYTSGMTLWPIRPGMETGRRVFVQLMLRARSSQVNEEIDLHFYPREILDPRTGGWVFGFGISLMYARSKGRVRLTSRDPEATLDIDHRWFSESADLQSLADGVEIAARLATTPPLAGMLDISAEQHALLRDRDAVKRVLLAEAATTFHPSSTCRMGPSVDPTAVVDATCRVHGVDRLRVVDASIFPWGPRCNLHAPIIAVAERAADVIRRDT